MSGTHDRSIHKIVDVLFLSFEAAMHIYLSIYLISIGANMPVILFTLFELSMFFRLLWNIYGDAKSRLVAQALEVREEPEALPEGLPGAEPDGSYNTRTFDAGACMPGRQQWSGPSD